MPPHQHAWPADRWNTRPVAAHVLAVARTLTSATRVLDVLTLLRRDGIERYFTINPGSAFADGLDDYLRDLPGITVLDWEDAVRRRFDLAVACAVHASMHRLDARLVVLPHGAGYNRLVTESTGDTVSSAGLSRNELTYHGRVFVDVLGLSHPEQLDRLRISCPEALDVAQVVGDPCFDRMLRSRRSRDGYRAALGAVDGRRLVVVNSTWSGHSLFGRHPDLPQRLVRQLPADEYTVAVVLHPNIWNRHDPEALLDDARRMGLRLIPPHQGWQAALVAADCLIGDHGSVSVYGAALERPTLLVATGAAELDPHSPSYAFGQTAPALDPDGDLLAQLEQALHQDPAGLRPITDRSLAHRGESAQVLRPLLYSFLDGLDEPRDEPVLPPYPKPVPRPGATDRPTAYDVEGKSEGTEVSLRRYPFDPDDHTPRGFHALTDEHPDDALRYTAEVLARTETHAERPATRWLADTAAELPGLAVAVAALGPARHLLRLHTGLLLEARAEPDWDRPDPTLDPLLLGSAVASWLADGGDPTCLPGHGLTIRTGDHHTRVSFSTGPQGLPGGP
ncbi:hypothetical protein P3T27_005382 [Kitasatospora sp. MAA19]|uniref:hypothetical protein n=1 Tax=Kitasatospora sp. MAA19 TaxID=3035090 RepID=UPI002475E2EE|nr:hypothetical protein [Kitasatospora sp. MAA19]MDH6708642.1 hypothetical protein [Kitasatospora sp. MAA19]